MRARPTQPPEATIAAIPRVTLQRCSCGGGGECEGCRRKKMLQRSASTADATPHEAPEIVHSVLAAPGDPLDGTWRSRVEPRFGHDFSSVRIHTGSAAAASARAVGAHAYTVGPHVVFGERQFNPGTAAGDRLLAHELAHVIQQRGAGAMPSALTIEDPSSPAEREAETAAANVIADRPAPAAAPRAPAVMRKLVVDKATAEVPNNSGGIDLNGAIVEGYLAKLAPAGKPTVDLATGEVSMATPEFCKARGSTERFGRGFLSGMETGAKIGAFFFGVGALPGALLGGLIGGFIGLGGADSKAEESSKPTGSTCICDFINSGATWHIEVDDTTKAPHKESNKVVVWSPYNRVTGTATQSGALVELDQSIVLAHELCGHLWLEELNNKRSEDPTGSAREREVRERENLIRKEQGVEARGLDLKDPYCGESFFREKGDEPGTARPFPEYDESQKESLLKSGMTTEAERTNFVDCMNARVKAFGEEASKYRIDERIP